MKNLIKLLYIILILVFMSCSTTTSLRVPADIKNKNFEAVFSFPSYAEDTKISHQKDVKQILDMYSNHLNVGRRVDFILNKDVTNKIAHKVELFRETNGMYIYQVTSSPAAFKDTVATNAMMNFVYSLLEANTTGGNLFSMFEMYYNAQEGDPVALDNFLKIKEQDDLIDLPNDKIIITKETREKYMKPSRDLRQQILTEIKSLKKQRKSEEVSRKTLLEKLDKAPDEKQFRALVAKNDRKGAMKLLKQYLPWEDMAPFEKKFWENYIEITSNPLPLDQRVLIYRGLDEDYIHRAIIGGKELTEKEAIITSNAFIMSSGMVKNQGSWNRRLRSLEAMNKKYIATYNLDDEYAQSSRISAMFGNHAQEPIGSPFLSFTPDYATARGFGSERISTYLIDPRLLNYNYASSFITEYEFLIPLTTFPDELVGIADKKLLPKGVDSIDYLEHRLKVLISESYDAEKQEKIFAQIKRNSYDFFKLRYMNGKEFKAKNVPAENLKFYKNFLKDKGVVQPMKPNGELTCKDLIELFWMAN